MIDIDKQTISNIFQLPVEYLFLKENINFSRKQYFSINKIYKGPIKRFIKGFKKLEKGV